MSHLCKEMDGNSTFHVENAIRSVSICLEKERIACARQEEEMKARKLRIERERLEKQRIAKEREKERIERERIKREKEHKLRAKSWNKDEVAAWLRSLQHGKYAQYAPKFVAMNYAGEDFECLDKGHLKDCGVMKPSHQSGIMNAIKDLLQLSASNDADDTNEEKRPQSAGTGDAKASNSQCKRVENPFVMLFGMGKYVKKYHNLDDIIKDEECLSNVFEGKFKYQFVTNADDHGYNQTWTLSQAIDWITLIRDNEIIDAQNRKLLKYDALIFCGASHGSIDAMICSNGEELKCMDIRSLFANCVNAQFENIP
eukprot:617917_1